MAGFLVPGNDCGDTESTKFRDNVSHSIAGSGALVYPDVVDGKNQDECYEMSHIAVYKTTWPGVAALYFTKEVRAHDITSIDCQKGISLNTGREGDDLKIKLYDSHIYGETEALDCPQGHDCYCP